MVKLWIFGSVILSEAWLNKVHVQYCPNCGGMSYMNIRLEHYKTWSILSVCDRFKVVNDEEYVCMTII